MKNHPVVHFEIGCHDGEKTREFFAQLFGWEIADREAGLTINTGGPGAIDGHIAELAPEWGNYVTIYVEVEDLEVYLLDRSRHPQRMECSCMPECVVPDGRNHF